MQRPAGRTGAASHSLWDPVLTAAPIGRRKKMNDGQTEEKRKLGAYSTVGLMFPASIAVGLAIGYFLDRWLDTAPYLLIVFTLYGVGAGFRNLLKLGKTKPRGPNDPKE